MKPTANTFRNLATVMLLMAAAGFSPLTAAPGVPAAVTNAPTISVFIWPSSPKEGKDPFFPNSIYPYKEAVKKSDQPPALSELKLEGVSIHGKIFLCIINGETFGPGDENDVKTATGKLSIRCLQINATSAVIESGGQIKTLTLSNP